MWEQVRKTCLSVNMTSKDGEYDDQTDFQDCEDVLYRASDDRDGDDHAKRAGAGGRRPFGCTDPSGA